MLRGWCRSVRVKHDFLLLLLLDVVVMIDPPSTVDLMRPVVISVETLVHPPVQEAVWVRLGVTSAVVVQTGDDETLDLVEEIRHVMWLMGEDDGGTPDLAE
jgi:hypothetical protein